MVYWCKYMWHMHSGHSNKNAFERLITLWWNTSPVFTFPLNLLLITYWHVIMLSFYYNTQAKGLIIKEANLQVEKVKVICNYFFLDFYYSRIKKKRNWENSQQISNILWPFSLKDEDRNVRDTEQAVWNLTQTTGNWWAVAL